MRASSPTELGIKLVNDGPHKQEPANRRIRGLLGDQWIFDSLDARYVWEHQYCMSPAKATYLASLSPWELKCLSSPVLLRP